MKCLCSREATLLLAVFETILHLWLAHQCHSLGSSLKWEQDESTVALELFAAVLQLSTGWCLAGSLAALAVALVGIPRVRELCL